MALHNKQVYMKTDEFKTIYAAVQAMAQTVTLIQAAEIQRFCGCHKYCVTIILSYMLKNERTRWNESVAWYKIN